VLIIADLRLGVWKNGIWSRGQGQGDCMSFTMCCGLSGREILLTGRLGWVLKEAWEREANEWIDVTLG